MWSKTCKYIKTGAFFDTKKNYDFGTNALHSKLKISQTTNKYKISIAKYGYVKHIIYLSLALLDYYN